MWIPTHYYKRYNYSHPDAAFMIAVPYIVMVFAAPIVGLIVDRVGKLMFFTNLSCICLCVAHMLLFEKFG